jgi:fucose permease
MVLIAMTVLIILFTMMAVADGGLDLFSPFLSPIFAMSWQGQFNIDFTAYLILSGIWMAWRSGFSRGGMILGICTPPLGILFFAPYLIYLISNSNGDARKLLLGVHA